MALDSIIPRKGTSITLYTQTQTLIDGYLINTETATGAIAILQPLGAEEQHTLADLGVEGEALKAYLPSNTSVEIGDQVEYNNKRYNVRRVEKTREYTQLLLERI